jgi:hypothetical protein
VGLWTIDDPETMDFFIKLDAGMITDYLDRLREVIADNGVASPMLYERRR